MCTLAPLLSPQAAVHRVVPRRVDFSLFRELSRCVYALSVLDLRQLGLLNERQSRLSEVTLISHSEMTVPPLAANC